MEQSILQTIKDNKPQLRNEFDAVVAVLHLVMKELGFRCVGLAEGQPLSNNNADIESKPFPDGWNQSPDSYSFQYKHTQSSMTFFVKSLVMNDKLLVHGIAKEDNKIFSLELSVRDYVAEKSLSNYDALYKDLGKLIALFKINIPAKFLPDINKPGYEATTTESETTTSNRSQAPPPRRDPLEYEYPPRFQPPPDNDPLRIPGTGRQVYPPTFGVGYRDLYPTGPGFGVPPGAQGNLIGPTHPAFGPGVNDPYAFGPNNPFGGPGMPPRGMVPGARFDPLFPPPASNPSFQPRRNNRDFGDDLPPPGFGDNMYM